MANELLVEAPRRNRPFRGAVLRGLAVVMPPLLTIVILVWIGRTVTYYVLEPVTTGARNVVARYIADVKTELPNPRRTNDPTVWEHDEVLYKRLPNGTFVPLKVYATVRNRPGAEEMPATGEGIYQRYVEIEYLRPYLVFPVFLLLFVLVMYLLGSLFAAGLGRVFWNLVEGLISHVPFIRGVYGSVKQVTEYVLSETELEFSRVVAVQYPWEGNWTLGFVTGEGLLAVRDRMGEPMLSVLFPTLPMPITGNVRMVPRREVIDLDFTVDQACQYIISCGVIVPAHQLPGLMTAGQPALDATSASDVREGVQK